MAQRGEGADVTAQECGSARSQPGHALRGLLRHPALYVCLAMAWMVSIGVIYFLPGHDGLTDPHLQTPPPGALFLEAVAGAVGRALGHLAAAGAVFVAAWGYGRGLLALPLVSRQLHRRLPGSGVRALVALGLGLGSLSLLALVLAPLGWLRPAALMVVAAVGVVLAVVWRPRRWPSFRGARLEWVEWAALALLAAAAVFALVGALAPEVEYDALWYHLEFADRHLAAGTIVDEVCQYVSTYPWGTELVFAYGLTLDGPAAAKLIHFGFGVLMTGAAYEFGRALAGRRAGLFAALVLAATPTVLWEATTAYVELAVGFFVLLALRCVLLYVEQRSLPLLALAGLFLGFALSTKHLAVIAAVPLALLVFWASGARPLLARLAPVALFTVIALLPALPWYIRAQVQAGNPVLPLLYDVFGGDPRRWSEASDAGLARFEDRFGQGRSLVALLKLPWSMTMHGAAFGGCLGVAYLMLVPLALHRRLPKSVVLILLFCLGYLVLWASPVSSLQMRLIVPVLAPLAVVAGYGLDRALTCARAWRLPAGNAVAVMALIVFALSLPPFLRMHERDRSGDQGWLTHVLREVPVNVVTGAEPEDEYLQRRLPAYGATVRLNALAGPDDRVVVATDPFVDLYSEPAMVPDFAVCLRRAGLGSGDAADHNALLREGVDFVLVEDRLRADSVVRWHDDEFARRYLDLVYADDRARLYRVRPVAAG